MHTPQTMSYTHFICRELEGTPSSRMQWKKMHCRVCSVSSVDHVTAPLLVQDLAPASCRAGESSSPCLRHFPRTSFSFTQPIVLILLALYLGL